MARRDKHIYELQANLNPKYIKILNMKPSVKGIEKQKRKMEQIIKSEGLRRQRGAQIDFIFS